MVVMKDFFVSKKTRIIFLAAAIVFIIIFFIGQPLQAADRLTDLSDGWYYIENGEKKPVSLPHVINYKGDLTIRNDISDRFASYVIYTVGARYNTEIFAGSKPIFRFNDHGLRRNETVLSNVICLGQLTANVGATGIAITYINNGSDTFELPRVYVGSWRAVLIDIVSSNLYTLTITLALIALGIISFAFAAVSIHRGLGGKNLMYVALFLMLCGTWCFTDSNLIQMLTDYSIAVTYIDFFAFMLMPVPLFRYISNTGTMKRYSFFPIYIELYLFDIIVQTVFVKLGFFSFFDMLFVTQLVMIAGVAVTIILLIKEHRLTDDRNITVCLRAFIAAGILGAASIVLYNFASYSAYQCVFQTGILLYVIILLFNITTELINNMRYRTEAEVYRNLSEVDKLTGLKNRRAFDMLIASFETGEITFSDAALIFADVNGLKYVNDNFGHFEGDELLIAAAGCIERAYSSLGYCYRLGGDEFCSVITDPTSSEERLLERLTDEVCAHNAMSTTVHPLSVARGCSFIKNNDGSRKTLSDWKSEADKKMYENKKLGRCRNRED